MACKRPQVCKQVKPYANINYVFSFWNFCHTLVFFVCLKREDVLLNEMDATGQAFEDMQEQNTRLLQQLREKDDANFKLMSEVLNTYISNFKSLKKTKQMYALQL